MMRELIYWVIRLAPFALVMYGVWEDSYQCVFGGVALIVAFSYWWDRRRHA